MKLNIYENGILLGEDVVINGVWTHRWFDKSTKQFHKTVHNGRLQNFYPWNKWQYIEVK